MKDEKLYAERDHRALKPRYSGDISAMTAEDLREKGDILDKLVRREEGGDDMSKLREAAQEALFWMQHARLHLTIKERLHPDGLIQYDNAARNLRAALAQPETEAEPVAWQRRYAASGHPPSDWLPCLPEDVEHYSSRSDCEVRPLYAHPPRDEWRPASEPPEDAMFSRGAVAAIVAGAIYDFAGFMTTRPVSVSIGASDACGPVVDLITSFAEKRGLDLEEAAVQSWNLCIGRDVQPPTEVAK